MSICEDGGKLPVEISGVTGANPNMERFVTVLPAQYMVLETG
jgi:hypothetical protein